MSEPVIPGGCIFISRKILESEIWEKPPLYMKVWMYLLLRAQHKDFKGLKRGQVSTSIPEIIEAVKWKVGARIERPTKDQVFQVINWMRSTKTQWEGDEAVTKATMITTTKATQSLLVNIDNYWFYQDISNYESNAEDNDENPTKATRKQRQSDNINKNVKNEQECEEGKPLKPIPVPEETDTVAQVIEYLNIKTGKNFNPTTKETAKLINGRLKEGRTILDFKYVIDVKTDEWLYDEKMREYLAPGTLFNQSKFEKYMNQSKGGGNSAKFQQGSKTSGFGSTQRESEFAFLDKPGRWG